MGRISIRELKQMGVSQQDLDAARATQEAQRRNGSPVVPLAVICGVQEKRPKGNKNATANLSDILDMTGPAMRKRGRYDQAALLLDQVALSERSPERASEARELASRAKVLGQSVQLDFDFFGGGNVSIAFQYQDAVTERLFDAASSTAQAKEAMSILWTICRHLGWQTYECTKTVSDLCEITRTDKSYMSRALDLLEQVGAITRVKRGPVKIITVTPEGAFRGAIKEHGKTVKKYRLEVIEGGQANV